VKGALFTRDWRVMADLRHALELEFGSTPMTEGRAQMTRGDERGLILDTARPSHLHNWRPGRAAAAILHAY